MAFFSKTANILRQTVTRHISPEISASNPSIFQLIRSMSSSKVFIGGLSYGTDNDGLKDAFANYGHVIDARVIVDRETGRSRGFGFVTYSNSDEASAAIQALDGKDLHGRNVRVNYATDRARGYGGGDGGNFGGEGGGYGNNRGYNNYSSNYGAGNDGGGYGNNNRGYAEGNSGDGAFGSQNTSDDYISKDDANNDYASRGM